MGSVEPGQQLDHYEIESAIAHSGMATIFRGRDLRDGRQVAIKLPLMEAESDVAFYERFQREEKIGLKLVHRGVAKVIPSDGRSRLYLVMEWVEGKPLRALLNEQHKLSADRAGRITLQICDALAYIHSQGVVHRDLKPENILIDANDNIKLIDFGIAGSAGSRRLTFGKFSNTMGTPDYISPEQVKSKRGDARSDLFALGVMLYEMLTGEVPFKGPNPFAVMNDRLLNDPIPPCKIDRTIPPQLQKVIYRALKRDPEDRYATAQDFAYDLEHLDEVGAGECLEMPMQKHRRASWQQKFVAYAPLALIPTLIFTLLLYVSRHP
jgi:serine/threonine-protein kinase